MNPNPPAIIETAHVPMAGIASWYGERHRGKLMANGKPFNPDAMTCASWHYPFGTLLKVTSQNTGAFVIVEVTDRGPSKKYRDRIIDLSKAAFNQIYPTHFGLDDVKVEVVK